MERKTPKAKTRISLPALVNTPMDLGRLIQELEVINENLLQQNLRHPAGKLKMPKTGQLIEKIATDNKLKLSDEADRKLLKEFLEDTRQVAPRLHVSFSADPSSDFIEKLVTWLRREIHPSVLVSVGLQPNMGAGCIVRTANKQFDFSLRQDFSAKKDLLLQSIAKSRTEQPAAAPNMSEATA